MSHWEGGLRVPTLSLTCAEPQWWRRCFWTGQLGKPASEQATVSGSVDVSSSSLTMRVLLPSKGSIDRAATGPWGEPQALPPEQSKWQVPKSCSVLSHRQ